ncbi:c-type cytochrome biogenesis protein CcmI [Kaarinaea lacus]
MTLFVFWIVAVLLIAAALLFLLPPLLLKTGDKGEIVRKDINVMLFKDQLAELDADLNAGTITQDQFEQAKHDLERSLLQDVSVEEDAVASAKVQTFGKKSAIAVVVFIPVLAIVLYQILGSGEAGLKPEEAQLAQSTEGHQGTIEEQIRKLQEHLQSNPDDMEGWTMLARSYYFLKNYQAASETFARVVAMTNESDANLLVAYADALAMAQGRTMDGRPMELVKKALELQPFHTTGLWLAGTASYQAQDYPAALGYWEKLVQLFPQGSEQHTQMLKNIAEVKQLMGQDLEPELIAKINAEQSGQSTQSTATTSTATAASGNASVSGEVSIDPALNSKVSPSDTVFIFARAANGPRMPLAILKKQVSDLPIKFTLDDSLAMNPGMALSKFQEIIVAARVSKTGNAMPQSGDLKGSTSVIKVGAQNLKIIIDSAVP